MTNHVDTAGAQNRMHMSVWPAYIIVVALFAAYTFHLATPRLSDDELHAGQISTIYTEIANGDTFGKKISAFIAPEILLPMYPFFHTTVATVAWIFRAGDDTEAFRLIATLINMCALWAFYTAVRRKLHTEIAGLRTLALLSIPFFFIYVPSLYTDICSLLFVFLTVTALEHKSAVAGLWGTLSWFVRQSAAGVIATLLALDISARDERLSVGHIRAFVRERRATILSVLAFLLFVFMNNGIALNYTEYHTLIPAMPGNIFQLSVLFAVLLLPFHVNALHNLGALEKKQAVYALLCACGAFIVFLMTNFPHAHNAIGPAGYLHNAVIQFISDSYIARALLALVGAIGAFFLAVEAFRERSLAVIILCTLLTLIPIAHVSPRYTLPFFALYLLFKKSGSEKLERTQALYLHAFALASLFLLVHYHIEL